MKTFTEYCKKSKIATKYWNKKSNINDDERIALAALLKIHQKGLIDIDDFREMNQIIVKAVKLAIK